MFSRHSCQHLIINKDLNFCRWTVNLSDSFNNLLWKFYRQMLFRVEEHGGADAIFAVCAMKHIYIYTTFAATPERLVVCKVGKCNRQISQLSVHFHHGRARGEREYLSMWPSLSGKCECEVLDTLCQSDTSEVWVNYQSRCCYVVFVAPSLDVTEACKLVTLQSYNSLSFAHLCGNIFRRALCDARTTLLGSFCNCC